MPRRPAAKTKGAAQTLGEGAPGAFDAHTTSVPPGKSVASVNPCTDPRRMA